VTESLAALLKLLQSEDRRTAVEKERERLNNLLKGVQDAINQQRSARARTQNSTAPSSAAPDQQQAIRTADELLEDIKNHDDQQQRESGDKQSDSGEQQGKPSDQNSDAEGKPQEGSESESAKPDQKGSESEGMPKDPSSKPSEDPSESSPSQQSQDSDQQSQSSEGGQQSQSQSSESEQESQQTPGRQQMENARRYMQEALEGLQKQEKERAVSEQDKSLQELNEAAEELEKTLKQLREEEKEMILAALEARFQRMLTLQTAIYEGTLALAATPTEDWLDNLHSQARELAGQQAELSVDCSQTAALLREDGTSVSIVVAVEDIESDMKASAVRLKDSKVGPLTQTLQTDIIESLKELIEATQREMQEMKSDQRQQQQQQGGEQQKPPLVELMAEIKVLRSLQLRVNRRTKQIDDLFRDSDSQDAADLQEQLGELAARQHRLRESAAELAERVRKNR
jgi:outer membrane murein-binding lipoprotein Lpp